MRFQSRRVWLAAVLIAPAVVTAGEWVWLPAVRWPHGGFALCRGGDNPGSSDSVDADHAGEQ